MGKAKGRGTAKVKRGKSKAPTRASAEQPAGAPALRKGGAGKAKAEVQRKKDVLDPSSAGKERRAEGAVAGDDVGIEAGLTATTEGGATKGKGRRKGPKTTLQENMPEIAVAMEERAKAGSYLHARALTDLVEASEARKTSSRTEKKLVVELLERLEKLSCGCGKS